MMGRPGRPPLLTGALSPALLALVKPQLAESLTRYVGTTPAAAAAEELVPLLEELLPRELHQDAATILMTAGAVLARRARTTERKR